MKKLNNIKVIAFDYGGTLDLPGLHWFDFLWELVSQKLSAYLPVSREEFWEAYVYGERKLEKHVIPQDTNLYQNLLIKARYEVEYFTEHTNKLAITKTEAEKIASLLADYATQIIIKQNYPNSEKVLAALSQEYTIYIVSNYYGNLETILKEAGFLKYVSHFIDSTLVGIRKPDPGIWQLAIDKAGVAPEQILVVGDSMKNDILPAQSLGCQTAWLTGNPTEEYKGMVIGELVSLICG